MANVPPTELAAQPFSLRCNQNLCRWTATCLLALGLASHALWLPSTGWSIASSADSYPQIPMLEVLCGVPALLDSLLTACLVVSLLGLLFGPAAQVQRWSAASCLAAMTLVALDQQRLQPWFYQWILFTAVWTLGGYRQAGLKLMQALVISIYLFSALGKIDYEFLHTVGLNFVRAPLSVLGISTEDWPLGSQLMLVGVLPVAELLLAIGLCIPATRRIAALVACLFHILLMLLFSPLILGHSLGVLLWNAQFAGQAILLFYLPGRHGPLVQRGLPSQDTAPSTPQSSGASLPQTKSLSGPVRGDRVPMWAWAARLIVGAAICLPLLERWGYWDHWPSWALYAPHSSRVEVYVAKTAWDRLPAQVVPATPLDSEAEDDDYYETLWVRVATDRWCLAATRTPIYPQSRVGLGVARYLAETLDSEFEIRVNVKSVANRWNGKRDVSSLEGRRQIENFGKTFWLNTRPRQP
ncbi:hypothetical protein [Aureliella helgolandensis]|uniref:Vitamin K-dependent gamma-carboxylase n=1 Tax=Aureliella helgolandensis TaxID=2527968 RepID=A0A518G4L7_9BACT|nr:hypothetical protein [Aureliella helgolandensis]QDV23541.1 hypothetical protein Q31a_18420 [Aureliella helgolandensis]